MSAQLHSRSEAEHFDPLQARSVRVAVLGAGMSGICVGSQLKERGIHDFVILEKADSVGGTWRENTYPGIACDVPSHLYSFSFELNPNWSHNYGSGAEIWQYCRDVAKKYGLEPHLRFDTEVSSVEFDGARWQVNTADGETITADVVVSGLGGLHLPNHPKLAGLADFEGTVFHTAEWNHDHDLEGRRVAIIGTGASAAQVLPEIADEVAEVSVFQRSAAWVFPRQVAELSEERRARFRRSPWRMRLFRWFLFVLLDGVGVLSLRRNTWFARLLKKTGLRHLNNSVNDPELRRRLTPDYEPGCKRRCISDDYLTTFNKENVHLVTDAISCVESGGIRDTTGKLHEVDTIIEATGFRPFDITDYVSITGARGVRLRDAWSERVNSFRTIMVPGFPNFFLLLGPNSATGHTSALIMIESQTQYVLQCLDWMEREGISQLDPDPQIVADYNARLQRDLKKMVFSGGCNAWYTDDKDQNFTLWPYSAARFIAEQRRPRKSEFRTLRSTPSE
jgi:cation diffusion facilitator CzcD-associated flavoprotein CzcO